MRHKSYLREVSTLSRTKFQRLGRQFGKQFLERAGGTKYHDMWTPFRVSHEGVGSSTQLVRV